MINSLESNRQSYSHAKELLLAALASKDILVSNVIDKLSQLKLNEGSDPFEYISQMRMIAESVEKHQINVDSFLQHFFWKGLNPKFQNQLVLITNKTRPSLAEINQHFFSACERYRDSIKVEELRSAGAIEVKTAFAAKVNYKKVEPNFIPCVLCSNGGDNADHPIFKCVTYQSPSAKLSKLREINACSKCAKTSHALSDCKYRFKSRCRTCSAWHFTFLCDNQPSTSKTVSNSEARSPKPKNSNKKNAEAAKSETVATVTIVDSLNSDINNDCILPTFSCIIGGEKIRALKDGGAQSNFISSDLADALGAKVVNNVYLTVNGINIPCNYYTKLVEVDVKFGDRTVKIHALCLPKIGINLKLPELGSIVRAYKNIGFDLADQLMTITSDSLSDIKFILGTKSGYCVPEHEVVFGMEKTSIYAHTPIGVIIKGDMSVLLRDIPYISEKSTNCLVCPVKESATALASSNNIGAITESPMRCYSTTGFHAAIDVLNESGNLVDSMLKKAADDALNLHSVSILHSDNNIYDDSSSELNDSLVQFALNNTKHDSDGRPVMPLLWNSDVSHLLGSNRNISEQILKSNLKRVRNKPDHLKLIDEVIKTQESVGIVEKIDNLDEFLESHPSASFLPHMAVYKRDRET